MMQSQGCKLIKGRSILFIDDKKVKIKGSEVGYPFTAIEQTLYALNQIKTGVNFLNKYCKNRR